MSQPTSAAVLVVFCFVSAARAAWGQTSGADVGESPNALPGVVRVGIPVAPRTGLAGAGTAGYGFTESVLSQGDKSHRVFGSLAASFRPNDWFAAALRFDGRYDWHSNVPDGNGGGAIGEPRILLRAASGSGDFKIGAEANVRFPGESAPSVNFAAVSPELSLLAAYAPAAGQVSIGSQIGFRYDRSGDTVPTPDRLLRADRMSLGVSDTNALLLGLGFVFRASKSVEALAEWSWDVRVPSKGAGAMESPMRIDLGGRYYASDTLALQLVAEVSPSSRPTIGPGAPLVVIEPRASVFAGISFRPSVPAPEETRFLRTRCTVGRVVGRVTDDGGRAIAAAKVHIGKADSGIDVQTSDYGAFERAGVPIGKTDLTVSAEGYREQTRALEVTAAEAPQIEIQLEKALPQGQIRGLARSFAGQPIKGGTVRIEPLGKEVTVGEGGRFEVDVPPGEYDVIVKATGYADQHRHVKVEASGVVVLDLDMRTRR